jgi:hypothetical protein
LQARQAGAAFSSTASTAVRIAGLLIEFATTHFFFDSGVFDQLSKTLYGILYFLSFS